MKQLILIFFTAFLPTISVFSQNLTPLTVKEAFDFAVGDTFQYSIKQNAYSPWLYRQVVILSRTLDSIRNKFIYTQQVDAFTPSYTIGSSVIALSYNHGKQINTTDNLDSLVKIQQDVCNTPIPTPTPTLYCYDSLKIDYGNRKTLKHEFNNNRFRTGKIHYSTGLGQTLDYLTSEDPNVSKNIKMTYFNKQGQIWGIRSSSFDEQKALCKPLTNREVYDFEIGDIFIYKTRLYNFNMGRLDTLYERRTIINKKFNLPDSITYFIKKESVYTSTFNKLIVKTDTSIVKNLNSSAVERLDPNKPPYPFATDYCSTLSNSDRKQYGRTLNRANLLDYCEGLTLVQGVGVLTSYTCSFSTDGTSLIYFKKGTETWGTPIDFPTSLFTPSVFQAKISLSPNPTNSILNIETDIDFDKIQVTNLNGQVVLKENKTTQITLSNLPNGIYFMQFYGENVLKGVKKFVIHH